MKTKGDVGGDNSDGVRGTKCARAKVGVTGKIRFKLRVCMLENYYFRS